MTSALPLACLALLLVSAPARGLPLAQQGEGEGDLLDLSIEELLDIRVPTMTTVLGGHLHNEGEWMAMVHVMRMEMDGMRDGTNDLSSAQVLATYPVTPTAMTMDMVMLGLMYAPTDRLTMMAMVPYVEKSMDHVTGMGGAFTTRSEGFGDVQVSGLVLLRESESSDLILNLGVGLPTGSIDEKDTTPMGPGSQLPYPMQLGSGTYDLLPGLTLVRHEELWEGGVQGLATVRLGRNDRGYSLGDRVQASVWGTRKWTDELSTSARLTGLCFGDVDGADAALNPATVPTADPDLQSGKRLDFSLGMEYYRASARTGTRAGVEVGLPVYEDLDGPQMSVDWWLAVNFSVTVF